jgi:hypothetical protein
MLSIITLCVTFSYSYAECHHVEFRYAECRYAECSYVKCHYVECHYVEYHYTECRYAECSYAECRGVFKNLVSPNSKDLRRQLCEKVYIIGPGKNSAQFDND